VRHPIGFRKNRLEGLQDAVFAVALTLLTIDLRVPLGLTEPDLRGHLFQLLPALGVYGVTFAFVGIVWLFVYSYQEVVTRQDIVGSTLVVAASGSVALLPFTSSTFANYSNSQVAGHFFILNICLIVAIYAVYIEYANRRLIPPDVDRRLLRTVAVIVWVSFIYIALIDLTIVPSRPQWILPAVMAGYLYAYVSVFILHSRFVAEHDRVRRIESAQESEI